MFNYTMHTKNTREIAEEKIIVVLLVVLQPSADGKTEQSVHQQHTQTRAVVMCPRAMMQGKWKHELENSQV